MKISCESLISNKCGYTTDASFVYIEPARKIDTIQFMNDIRSTGQGFAIAIDGPVASGKGTIAKRLSQELGGFYLYSGGMYRAVALACINQEADVTDPEQVIRVLAHVTIRIGVDHAIILNGQNVTERIKEPDTASGGSVIAVIPHVRKVLVKWQHDIAREQIEKGNIVVAEGRDTGTVILPDAALKIFLTASPEVRARRRLAQYKKPETEFAQMVATIKERDERDTNRKLDPLPSDPQAHGYLIIDNSTMTEDETIEAIRVALKKNKLIV